MAGIAARRSVLQAIRELKRVTGFDGGLKNEVHLE